MGRYGRFSYLCTNAVFTAQIEKKNMLQSLSQYLATSCLNWCDSVTIWNVLVTFAMSDLLELLNHLPPLPSEDVVVNTNLYIIEKGELENTISKLLSA